MKTLYKIYEFLFDRWKQELEKKETIPVYSPDSKDLPTYYLDVFTYKLINKFDGSIKYKQEKFKS